MTMLPANEPEHEASKWLKPQVELLYLKVLIEDT